MIWFWCSYEYPNSLILVHHISMHGYTSSCLTSGHAASAAGSTPAGQQANGTQLPQQQQQPPPPKPPGGGVGGLAGALASATGMCLYTWCLPPTCALLLNPFSCCHCCSAACHNHTNTSSFSHVFSIAVQQHNFFHTTCNRTVCLWTQYCSLDFIDIYHLSFHRWQFRCFQQFL